MKTFKNKKILVTGGTGSFGYQIVSNLINEAPEKIVIFSRDEKKQYDMQNFFEKKNDYLEFKIGDVRNYKRIKEVMKDIDIVYNAAALKQVPNCEFNPFEAVKTNILGSENVRAAAIENNVEKVISISTDKAVKAVNVMGMTKAIQERIFLNYNRRNDDTQFIVVRYGNVIGSRGSVIPFFKERIIKNKFLPITSKSMTRFILTLNEAISLVFKATEEGIHGQLFVKKMPACYIIDLAKAMCKELNGKDNYPIKEVGIRPGEKIHEVLVSEEEIVRTVETKNHYIIQPYDKLNLNEINSVLNEYTSNSTKILNEKEIIKKLKQEGFL